MRTYLLLPLLLTGCPEYTLGGKVDVSDDAVVDSEETGEVDPPVEPDPPEDTGEEDPIEDPPEDEELCDGVDNDGDGEIDEGFPDTDGDGIKDCLELEYRIRLSITVDDSYSAWVDGSLLVEDSPGWNSVDEHEFVLDSGSHVISVHGWDIGLAISGHLSAVWIDDELYAVTGDGQWKVKSDTAPAAWTEPLFDDGDWVTPVACADVFPWGEFSCEAMESGAVWTWYAGDGDCRAESSYGDAFYRLVLELPGA
jgi:hypothetical protein